MKIQFDVIEAEKVPEDWPQQKSWPGPGVYLCKNEPTTLYIVSEYSVAYVHGGMMMARKIEGHGEGSALPETLVLKLIAAAARAEVLKA